MKSDITLIYERIKEKYPVTLCSSKEFGHKSDSVFTVLRGKYQGKYFELFYDGVSFPFYVKNEDGVVCAHFHLNKLEEAEKAVIVFMEGQNVSNYAFLTKMLKCMPSKDMREYLDNNPPCLSVLQQATIFSEYIKTRNEIYLIFTMLAEDTNDEQEKALLEAAIEDIKICGCPGKNAKDVYNKYFFKRGITPLFPFFEVCNMPILFKVGDIISYDGKLYYVAETPVQNRCIDFTDECYMCYPLSARINSKEDLFIYHEHIHVCEAEKADTENMTAKQKQTISVIKSLLAPSVKPDVIAAHGYCSNNRKMLEKDDICGCFYCLEVYSPEKITEFADGGKTALCPYCGVDAVIGESAGYPITKEFLKEMKDHWF